MTPERLDSSMAIDRASAAEIVKIIQAEDARIAAIVAGQADRVALAIEQIADRLAHGGRLFYAGAGTSGRIAMLDASELPPTYGIDPGMVSVIMAGGERAFFEAVEGAEDDGDAAIDAVSLQVRADDALVAIAASGTTPFTVNALRRANIIGALTVGVTSTANTPLASEADIAIVAVTGPEVIMGSSRMKSGTAQKMILNTISTGVMIRLGRVHSNLMIDMPATNEKLRSRAVRMVELASGATRPAAAQAVRASHGNLRAATLMAKRNIALEEAERLLSTAALHDLLDS